MSYDLSRKEKVQYSLLGVFIGAILFACGTLIVEGARCSSAKRDAFRRGWFEGTSRDSANWTRELDPPDWIYHSPREFTDAEIDSMLEQK